MQRQNREYECNWWEIANVGSFVILWTASLESCAWLHSDTEGYTWIHWLTRLTTSFSVHQQCSCNLYIYFFLSFSCNPTLPPITYRVRLFVHGNRGKPTWVHACSTPEWFWVRFSATDYGRIVKFVEKMRPSGYTGVTPKIGHRILRQRRTAVVSNSGFSDTN